MSKALAVKLLRESPEYEADARVGAPLNNSVAGSVLSLLYGIPRQYAEQYVREALAELDRQQHLSRGQK
jgi:hypothetical protein